MTTSDSPKIEQMKPANKAEELLLEKVKTGGKAEVSTDLGHVRQSFPQSNDDYIIRWDYEYIIHVTFLHPIRAAFLRHICLHPDLYEVDPGGIWILGALIAGKLDLFACSVSRPLALIGCRFDTSPDLMQATLHTVVWQGCRLPGLQADSLTVQGNLFLKASVITGETRLTGADIRGQLNCQKAIFTKKGGTAFSADGLKVGGGVFLTGVKVTGQTRLVGADIQGQLDCEGATFTNMHKDKNGEGPRTFTAAHLKVGDSVFLTGVMITGETRLSGAEIGGQLACQGAVFTNEGGDAFNAEGLKVANTLFWQELKSCPVGWVDFSFAQVGVLADDKLGWPEGKTWLDGFEYKRFSVNTTAETRIAWLRRMPDRGEDGAPVFLPQPYEQVIKVFKESGHEHEARKVAIAKQDAYAAHLKRVQTHGKRNTLLRRVLMQLFKITAGYGYKPWRALLWASWFILVMGWGVFGGAAYSGHMRPAKERVYMSACFTDVNAEGCKAWEAGPLIGESRYTMALPPDYPAFSALSYSLDVFVPIVDLHQESYWLPNEGQYRIYMWLHIVAGWVLTTIAVTGFAGVLKKD